MGDPDKRTHDEMDIDFSKVKGFFRKIVSRSESQQKPEEAASAGTAGADDQISFDFRKVKAWFGKKTEGAAGGDDAFDWKVVRGFISRYQLLLLLLIPIFIAADLRLMTTYLPITDAWAQGSVENALRGQVESQLRAKIEQEYPNLPEANKQKIIADN